MSIFYAKMTHMSNKYQINDLIRNTLVSHIRKDDICIDATLGKGRDSLFLLQHIPEGFLYGFDLQEEAVETSRKLLEDSGFSNFLLINDSHSNLRSYIKEAEIGCVMFNLGYLPGSDHQIHTESETTIEAIEACLPLLREDGIISVCFYPGTERGKQETTQTLDWLRSLDPKQFLVLVNDYFNRPNDPPLPVFIIRLKKK